jgi:hypothetical protein
MFCIMVCDTFRRSVGTLPYVTPFFGAFNFGKFVQLCFTDLQFSALKFTLFLVFYMHYPSLFNITPSFIDKRYNHICAYMNFHALIQLPVVHGHWLKLQSFMDFLIL